MATHTEATRGIAAPGRERASRLTIETKHALKTTELWAFIAAVAGVLIASQIVTSGNGSGGADNNGDTFDAARAWLYVTILTVGYLVSRGFAKAGSHEPYWADGDNQKRD